MLPFGLSSAPKIFTAFADALEWCVVHQGVECLYHYLDDYIMLGPPNSGDCQRFLDIMERVCHMLGVPLALDKKDGPTAHHFFGHNHRYHSW